MIYTKLAGGLGNQMFQYAAGRALSLRLESPLALDISHFPGIDNRSYELGIFDLASKVLGPLEEKILWFRSRRKVQRLRKLLPGQPLRIVENHGHDFDPRLARLSGELYLHGLWHFPAYFENIEEDLRRDFKFIIPPDEANRRLMSAMQESNSVALHVRRGDYLIGQENISRFGTCSLEYYQAAIQHMQATVSTPHFYVFSDDPDWARKNLSLPALSTFVTHNLGKRNYEDLRLMSHCRHFVIANSTFSWWGAWLGHQAEKQVIAPKKWFRDKSIPGLFPSDWIVLDL